jgi:anti-sigma B factor antagonist
VELSATAVPGRSAAVLAVQGEVDLQTAPELRREVARMVSGDAPHVIVDLSGVAFLDSTGLGALIAGRNSARRVGGSLSLVCRQLRLLTLLRATALDDVFAVHPTVDRALATLP